MQSDRRRNIAALSAVAILCSLLPADPAQAIDEPQLRLAIPSGPPIPLPRPASIKPQPSKADRICGLIEAAAVQHGLPAAFFARLIWKESRFDEKAVSPVGAQGIAQFMPGTAKIRGLKDPWDPAQAIPASAHFLADLKARLGNFGLAAAGYNGGPDRVARWMKRGGRLPRETVDYVHSITFRPVEWFREPGREVEPRPLEKGKSFREACARLPVIATRALAGGARRSPWGVQVAAGTSRGAALRAFSRVKKRFRRVIGGRSAMLVRQRGFGSVYSARIGAGSRASARRLCSRLRAAGGSCVVRRN